MQELAISELALDFDVPDDEEFVKKVRAEIKDARARCFEMLGKDDPKRGSGRTSHAEVQKRREHVKTLVIHGHHVKEMAELLEASVPMIQGDVEALRQQYGARSAHHLTALIVAEYAHRVRLKNAKLVELPLMVVGDLLVVLEAVQTANTEWATWQPLVQVQEALREVLPMEAFLAAVERYSRLSRGAS